MIRLIFELMIEKSLLLCTILEILQSSLICHLIEVMSIFLKLKPKPGVSNVKQI